MVKPFLWAVVVGLAIVWVARNYKKNKALQGATYTDKAGNPQFAGPDVDPITGDYTGPGDKPGTLGATQDQN